MVGGDGLITRFVDRVISAPGANTNIISTSITPKRACAFRISVILATTSVFKVTITESSGTSSGSLNEGVALQAGKLYTFVHGAHPDFSYNYQVETNGVITYLQVDEISVGAL